ncbi:MAG: class I SAM-dependent methyltransferase [Deltaproteobacteria bacterium]|nr:class I SAM-dependent methyltransferase [Deltaproteobacteria bacterium]
MSEFDFPAWSDHPDLVKYYSENRCRPKDLYASERRFLPWLARQSKSLLDTGCAAGGFLPIWRYYNPSIEYVGVDVSSSLIETARRVHPGVRFIQHNITAGLPLRDRSSVCVQALGWLNWEPGYENAIYELWRLADRYLFMDLRLVSKPDQVTVARQKIALASAWDGETTTPYVTVWWDRLANILIDLEPIRLLGYGYWGSPAETVIGIDHKVCFAAFVLEKASLGSDRPLPVVCLDLPLEWPSDLMDRVRLLPHKDLATLVVPPEPL